MLFAKIKLGILLSMIVCSGQTLVAQEPDPIAGDNTEDPIERIEIQGQSIPFYLHQLRRERDAFYQHYNALVGDSDLRIKCGKRKPEWAPVTLRKKDYCEPQFVYNLEYEAFQRNMEFSARQNLVSSPVNRKYQQKKQQMTALMNKLVNEHPKLKAKYEKFNQAQQVYENHK